MNYNGEVYIRKYPNSSRWLERNIMMSIYQPAVFLRKSLLTSIGFLREDFHVALDLEWFSRIAQKHSISIINKDIAKFRFHSESKTRNASSPDSKTQQIYYNEAIYLIQKYHKRFSWFINRFPKTALFLWFRIEKLMRIIERTHKNELKKVADKFV
jgi:hypothetical protein